MIGYLEGQIIAKLENTVLLNTNSGVGYQVFLPAPLLAESPRPGETVQYYVVTVVRDTEISLYGFDTLPAKILFESLITVSGIGPKVALALLSTFNAADLTTAIVRQDIPMLSTIPGIGKKIAGRLWMELGDRLGKGLGPPGVISDTRGELVSALTNLGFPEKDIFTVLQKISGDARPLSDQLKQALALLGKY